MTGTEPSARAALVTGASSGIGRATALALAARGATVWLTGRSAEALDQLAESAEGAVAHPADLTSDSDLERLASEIEARLPQLDLLVHCAGAVAHGALSEAPIADFDLQYATNARAPYLLTQLVLPRLRANRGQIVFVNSTVGLAARAEVSAYAASKHALKAIADSLREEVNADGIRVLSIYPGRTATPGQERIHSWEDKEYRPERLIQPEDVASAIVSAIELPRTAEITDLRVRPFEKP